MGCSQDAIWASASRLLPTRSDGWQLLLSEALTPDISESCHWGLLFLGLVFFFPPFSKSSLCFFLAPYPSSRSDSQCEKAAALPEMFIYDKEKALQRLGLCADARPCLSLPDVRPRILPEMRDAAQQQAFNWHPAWSAAFSPILRPRGCSSPTLRCSSLLRSAVLYPALENCPRAPPSARIAAGGGARCSGRAVQSCCEVCRLRVNADKVCQHGYTGDARPFLAITAQGLREPICSGGLGKWWHQL